MRKRVAVDLDGVIWDLLDIWIDYYNLMFGDQVTPEDIKEYDVSVSMTKTSRENIVEILTIPMLWKNVKPFENSYEYLSKLNQKYELVIATKSDYRQYKIKVERLIELFPFISPEQIICIDDKSYLDVDWLIDDYVENLKRGNFNKILIDAPYNKNEKDFIVAKDLKEAYEILENYYNGEMI